MNDMMRGGKFGRSGATVVVEEFLTGPEVSVLAFTDGKTVVPLPSSMDHKRAGDGDTGLNTGGMGVIAPNPFYTKAAEEQVMQSIILPTLNAMNAEGRTFRGCLYFGLMLTPNGPRVIEYNCRFGDPETQAVLPLVEGDLLEIMIATQAGTLDKCEIKLSDKSSCCLVLASGGYPENTKRANLSPLTAMLNQIAGYASSMREQNSEHPTAANSLQAAGACSASRPFAIRLKRRFGRHMRQPNECILTENIQEATSDFPHCAKAV